MHLRTKKRNDWLVFAPIAMVACKNELTSTAETQHNPRLFLSPTKTESTMPAELISGSVPLRAVKLALGHVSCALMQNQTVRCWGRNSYGELGHGLSKQIFAVPVEVPGVSDAVDIFMGGDPGNSGEVVCVLRENEAVTCWGFDANFPVNTHAKGVPVEIPSLRGVRHMALGGGGSLAVANDGRVFVWGSLGSRVRSDTLDPHGWVLPPTWVRGVNNAVEVAAGENHGCALKNDGSVMCWAGLFADRAPTVVPGVADAAHIMAGEDSDETCVLTTGHKVLCWGENLVYAERPELEGALQLSAYANFCARMPNGTALCWGRSSFGEMGAATTGSWTPVPIAGLTDIQFVATGDATTCAVRNDGSVMCLGRNTTGVLGNGTTVNTAVPVEVKGLTARTLTSSIVLQFDP